MSSTMLEALFVPLVTPRLVLEPIAERHADAMFAVLNDAELYRYMPSEAPAGVAQLRRRYRQLASGVSPDGERWWLNWIVALAQSGEAIGYVQATIPAGGGQALLGWTVGRAWQGRGYAREAVAAICRHFAASGITELHATIDARNIASITVAEALGFSRERVFESDDVIDGARGTDYGYVFRTGSADAESLARS